MLNVLNVFLDSPSEIDRCLDITEPADGVKKRPVAFFLVHGGGWKGGHLKQYYPVMQYLNERGYVTASTGYRLRSGEITAFDQLLDVRQSYARFTRYLSESNGGWLPPIVVMGSSAGAHLAALLAYAGPGECGEPTAFRESCLSDEWIVPSGAVLVCAPGRMTSWPDINEEIWTSMQAAVGVEYSTNTEERFKRLSPSSYLRKHICPTFLIGSENEIFFPHFMLREWQDKMSEVGGRCELKIYSGQSHGFLYECDSPGQQEALGDVVRFVESLDSMTGN